MRTLVPLLSLMLAGVGCAAARVRAEAAPTLKCAEAKIALEERTGSKDTWLASGCGRLAVCSLPVDVEGAEVRCAGGASVDYDPMHDRYAEIAVAKPTPGSRLAGTAEPRIEGVAKPIVKPKARTTSRKGASTQPSGD